MSRKEYLENLAGDLAKEILLNEVAIDTARKELAQLDEDIKIHLHIQSQIEEIRTLVERLEEKIQRDRDQFYQINQELDQLKRDDDE